MSLFGIKEQSEIRDLKAQLEQLREIVAEKSAEFEQKSTELDTKRKDLEEEREELKKIIPPESF